MSCIAVLQRRRDVLSGQISELFERFCFLDQVQVCFEPADHRIELSELRLTFGDLLEQVCAQFRLAAGTSTQARFLHVEGRRICLHVTATTRFLAVLTELRLPLDGVFRDFPDQTDSFQYVSNIVNAPLLDF